MLGSVRECNGVLDSVMVVTFRQYDFSGLEIY